MSRALYWLQRSLAEHLVNLALHLIPNDHPGQFKAVVALANTLDALQSDRPHLAP